ncbi:hypothetical protein L7F22_036450 [Adiantum nelumboides]|nr:hypothetical protein [Adiantum nelumboides]
MVGYGEPHGVKGYRLYNPATKHFFFSRSLVFDEDGLISASSTPKALPSPSIVADSDDNTTTTITTWHTPYDPLAQAQPALPALIPPPPAAPPAAPPPTTVHPMTPAATTAPHPSVKRTKPVSLKSFTRLNYGAPSSSVTQLLKWNTSGPRTQPRSTHYKSYAHAPRHTATPSTVISPSTSTLPSEQNISLHDIDDDPLTSHSHKLRDLEDIYRTSKPISAPASLPAHDEEFAGSAFSLATVADDVDDPITIAEALAGPHASEWRKAMEAELSSLQHNNTWTLVPLPADREAVSCKWILRRKLNPDGSIASYKARLVARGFSQTPGLDFTETFSPILRMSSFRLLLAMAVILNLELRHLDVQTAFLHGTLPEKIYMQQPPLFVSLVNPEYVCRLHRSLYGLKQSARLWFQRFNEFMLSHGYTRLQTEPNIYTRHTQTTYLIVALYVDDIPVLGSSSQVVEDAISELKSAFPITDLGELTYSLGLQIDRDRSKGNIVVHQSSYIDGMLQKFGLSSIKPSTTPIATSCKLSLNDCPSNEAEKTYMPQFPYRQLIGKMRYLVTGTRLDICYACNFLSRYMHNPGLKHWKALLGIARYLKSTRNYGIKYALTQSWNSSQPLLGWSNSDWGGGK